MDEDIIPNIDKSTFVGDTALQLYYGDYFTDISIRVWTEPALLDHNVMLSYSLDIKPSDPTVPDAVGLGWDTLTAINTFNPVVVWINQEVYPVEIIGRYSLIRKHKFADGEGCFVLKPEEFGCILEVRGP